MPIERLTIKHFSLKEFLKTSQNLPNFPEDVVTMENLLDTMERLDKIRERFGKPIRITSGFRSPAVNRAVGGVATSAHLKGLAADIVALDGRETSNEALLKVLKAMIKELDQLGIYRDKNGAIRWLHIGFSSTPRGMIYYG